MYKRVLAAIFGVVLLLIALGVGVSLIRQVGWLPVAGVLVTLFATWLARNCFRFSFQ
jgi:ATP/ADP translocase